MILNVESQHWVGIYDKREGDEGSQNGVALFDYVKDVNTFRFREASFQCTWENYQLISSYAVLLQVVRNAMDTAKMV